MPDILKKVFLVLLSMHLIVSGFAQQSAMETAMRSNGKIYVVLAVCLLILITLLFYIVRIDLKISRKEKNS